MDLFGIILFFWARWLSTLPGAPAWLRFVPRVLVFTFVVALTGVIIGIIRMETGEPGLSRQVGEGFALMIYSLTFALSSDVLVMLVLAAVTWRLRNPPAPE